MPEDNQSSTENQKENERIEQLINDFRKELVGLKYDSGNFFEKQLSYISAGALALSMVVVETVFKDISTTRWIGYLILSWACFGGTLVINLLSHLLAGTMHNKTISDIDLDKYSSERTKRRNFAINSVNYICVGLIMIGIFCFVFYTSKNIYAMNTKNKTIVIP